MLLSTDSVEPKRFVAVHGRRSLLMGYSETGLEIWGYPFQILSGYQIGFQPQGAATETDGRAVLRRIDYRPESVTRVYIGPDYVVRETLFVPLDHAAAVLTYEVEGGKHLDIDVHFRPVLNLMWPGAIGGQYTEWDPEIAGYVISEASQKFSAVVGSAEIVTHDPTVNSTVRTDAVSFSIRPRDVGRSRSRATVFVSLNPEGKKESAATARGVMTRLQEMESEAAEHYRKLEESVLQIETPDPEVNDAIAWSETALDQAWVCNPKLGCGIVAGYGPSRDARRPQYAWFFAGDGMVAVNALVSAGEYTRAREELSFIAQYQQPATGMLWHELSQSAGYLDWAAYPYMYVHVDISFDYLQTMARYVAVSGDIAFAKERWPSIAAAYKYCRSLISTTDHLPHIPPGKEGGDEQARPSDDLSLSAAWLGASSGFAELATATGHDPMAEEALKESALAKESIASYYWDAGKNFWIDGHTQAGSPITSRRKGPTELLVEKVFSPQQNASLLDQIASSDFQTDWGVRGLAATATDYDPDSYGRGSVTAPGTTSTASLLLACASS